MIMLVEVGLESIDGRIKIILIAMTIIFVTGNMFVLDWR